MVILKKLRDMAGKWPFWVLVIMAALTILFLNAFRWSNTGDQQGLDVSAILNKFQAGYDKRDVSEVDEYVRDLFDEDDVLIIGTRAFSAEDKEWCEGIEAVKKIVEWDWKYWGDLKMEIEKARIRINGNTAWVAMVGTSESRQTKEAGYEKGMKAIRDWQNQKKYQENPREFLLWLSYYTSRMLWDFEQTGGEEFVYPIRITAVLSNKKGKWLFNQMEFSYPTGYHRTRIIKEPAK
jgi:hypothetical protein